MRLQPCVFLGRFSSLVEIWNCGFVVARNRTFVAMMSQARWYRCLHRHATMDWIHHHLSNMVGSRVPRSGKQYFIWGAVTKRTFRACHGSGINGTSTASMSQTFPPTSRHQRHSTLQRQGKMKTGSSTSRIWKPTKQCYKIKSRHVALRLKR